MMNPHKFICCGSKNLMQRVISNKSWCPKPPRVSSPDFPELENTLPAWGYLLVSGTARMKLCYEQDKSLSQFGLDCLQQQIADNNIIMSTWEGCYDAKLKLFK